MSTPTSPPSALPAKGEATPPLVLIVEDEAPIADALVLIVEDAGYRAMVAPHGKAGLELALGHRPQLILSDLMMPHMSGHELISALRAALGGDAPPVILMTAADIRFTEDAGAASLLVKPFDLVAVEALLRRFLEPR